MNFTEAIQLANAGDERGYDYLYRSTFKSKYYLALQYMKNEEAAQDVMQDAYVRAFSKLNTLGNPESFPSWLGTIVANTARNALVKTNPMLFSDIEAGEDNEGFAYQIEDDRLDYRPETAYTRQETQQLVHELMDVLSEEQRICILMFHIEDIPIKEIASALNCSENTVKSRLRHGRDNLKVKAEALQKKGHKLYGVAPIPLLLYLLRSELAYLWNGSYLAAAGSQMANHLFSSSASSGVASASVGMQNAAVIGSQAAKTGFLSSVAAKVAIIVVGLGVLGSGIFFGVKLMNASNRPPVTEAEQKVVGEENITIEEGKTQEEVAPVVEEPVIKELTDADYLNRIVGNPTKKELEFILGSFMWEAIGERTSEWEYNVFMSNWCEMSTREGVYANMIETYGRDASNFLHCSLQDINRFFSTFTSFQYSEENDSDDEGYGVNVEGDVLITYPSEAMIWDISLGRAELENEEIRLYYTTGGLTGSDPTSDEYYVDMKATLYAIGNGFFRISRTEEVGERRYIRKDGELVIKESEPMQAPEYPVGTFSLTAPVGGRRSVMTIDPSGFASETGYMSTTNEEYANTFQMEINYNEVVPEGVTAYTMHGNSDGVTFEYIIYFDRNRDILYEDEELSYMDFYWVRE